MQQTMRTKRISTEEENRKPIIADKLAKLMFEQSPRIIITYKKATPKTNSGRSRKKYMQ